MKFSVFCKSLAATSLLAASGLAQGQAFDAVRLFGVPDGADGGLAGAVVISAPEYMGSNQRRVMVLPSIDYRWANGWFAGLSNGIGYRFQSSSDVQYGVRVTADLGRKQSRSSALSGMGDIDARPEAGVFFNYLPTREVFLTSSLRYGAGNDRNGTQLDLGAGYTTQFAPKWRGAVGVATTYVNGDYMQSYFGVTPSQSVTSGYRTYTPGAGIRDARLNASLRHLIDAKWSLTGALTARSLQGDTRNSPIVFQSSAVSGVLALSYLF